MSIRRPVMLALAVLALSLDLFAGPTEKFTFKAGPSLSGSEEFQITATKNGFRVSGTSHLQRPQGRVDLNERADLDGQWNLLHYTVAVNLTDTHALTAELMHQTQSFEASVQKTQVAFKASNGFEFHSAKAEVKPHTVVLDTMIVAHYQVLLDSLGDKPPASQIFWALVPQNMNAVDGQINMEKDASGTFDGKPVALHHFVAVVGGVTVNLWAEAGSNRLMRASMPITDHQLEITREGFVPEAADAQPAAPAR